MRVNVKSVYSILRGGAHGHLGLVFTDAKFALIFNKPFIYLTQQGPLNIPYGNSAHINSNTIIAHNDGVRHFCKVTGVKKSLVQQVVATVEEAYLVNFLN